MSPRPVKRSPYPTGPRPRTYVSPVRASAAAKTRAQLRDAARELFLERGYTGATTKAIATAAGVSEKTLFSAFPSKAALIAEVIRVGVRGEAPDERLVETDEWRAMLALPAAELLSAFAARIAEIHERTAPIVAVAEAAAATTRDPELLARRELGLQGSRGAASTVAEALERRGALTSTLDAGEAADVLDALASDAVYLRLTGERGWSSARYAEWLAAAAQRLLTD